MVMVVVAEVELGVLTASDGIQWTQLTGQQLGQLQNIEVSKVSSNDMRVLVRTLKYSNTCGAQAAGWQLQGCGSNSIQSFPIFGGSTPKTIPLPEQCLLQGLAGNLTVAWWTGCFRPFNLFQFVIFNTTQEPHHYSLSTPNSYQKHNNYTAYKFRIT